MSLSQKHCPRSHKSLFGELRNKDYKMSKMSWHGNQLWRKLGSESHGGLYLLAQNSLAVTIKSSQCCLPCKQSWRKTVLQCTTEFGAFRRRGELAELHAFSFSFLNVLKFTYHGQGGVFSLVFLIPGSKTSASPLVHSLNCLYVHLLAG